MSIYTLKKIPLGFYIYAYLRQNGTPYYIGKGQKKRAWVHFKNEIYPPKDKKRIIILESNLTEIGAFALERRYIKWWGRKDNNTGILRNKTDGGEGPSGRKFIMSAKHRENISISKRGVVPVCTHTRRKYNGSNNPKSKKCICPNGKFFNSAFDAAKEYNINVKTVQYRCRKQIMGWSYFLSQSATRTK